MPIYEYVCKACGHELETLQFLNEDPLTDCPDCGESELKRKISPAGFRLSGKGWYETDFKPKEKQRHVAGEGGKPDKKSDGRESSKNGAATTKSETSDAGASTSKPAEKKATVEA